MLNDVWQFVTVTYDGTTNNGTIYVNGVKKASEISALDPTTLPITENDHIYIGAEYNEVFAEAQLFHYGVIDEVQLYNRVLTTNEILANYNAGTGLYQPTNTTGLILWSKFDEGSGTTIKDRTSNANTGTFYGGGITWSAGIVPDWYSVESRARLLGIEGQNGWFTSDVTVTLSAWAGAGIEKTEYSFDNETWNTYTEPFAITTEGYVTINYKSTDLDGHVEQTNIETVKIDKTSPTGSTTINNNATFTGTTAVTLTSSANDATSGLAGMRCSHDNITYTSWAPYNLSEPWSLHEGDGAKTVYVQFKDYSGLVSGISSDTIILDTTPPTGSVMIDEGASITNTPSVTLSLTAFDATSGLSQIRFSNDNVTWTAWQEYYSSKTWTLTAGDGSKAVHAQFQDNAGSVSEIYSDIITLDTTPPNILITSPGLGSEIKLPTVRAIWQASDVTSGLSNYAVRLDGGSWIDVGLNVSHTFTGLADGNHRIEVRVTDMAGLTNQDSVDFIVNTSAAQGRSYTTEAIIIGIAIIAAVGVAAYLLKSKM